MSWQIGKVYIPAPYNAPGMVARVTESIIPRLYGPDAVDFALNAGWLQELSPHREGYRRFSIQLTDQRTYAAITVSFVLSFHGSYLN
ncbi:MAG: hypothetical protein H7338_16615 [Candidatus Sericytochromatia bacterium]|nr:hypothetical protein [Candidatus Sericytochromatia bacterium]